MKVSSNNKDADIFNTIASLLANNISYSDIQKMSYVMIANIIDALSEGEVETEEERQKRLDIIS